MTPMTPLMRHALAVAGVWLAFGAQAAGNLLVNGSFEAGPGGLGSFASWQTRLGDANTFVDSSGQTGRNLDQATDGLWFAAFGSLPGTGGSSIAQTFATTVGAAYVLTFDLANSNGNAPADSRFEALVGGRVVWSQTNLPQQNYLRQTIGFVAGAAQTTLVLQGYNTAGFVELDAVSVSAVPEPAAGTLIGLGGAGLVWYRRKAAAAASRQTAKQPASQA